MNQPAVPVNYQVTGVVPFTQYDPGGQVTEGVKVYFTTSTNLNGQVFAPNRIANDVNALRQVIEDQVSHLATIHQLSGTVQV